MLFLVNDEILNTSDDNEIAFYALVAELKLFTQENPINIEAGVDYKSILEKSKFLKTELNSVCEKYTDRISSFEIGEPTQNDEFVNCQVDIYLRNGKTKSVNISI